MRLFEIINTQYKNTDKEFSPSDINRPEDYSATDMSVGTTAKVNQTADAHVVQKQYHAPLTDLNNDAYYAYIKQIADNNLAASNPFFPRVYNVDVETDKQGKQKPSFDIEKLIPADQVDNDIVYGIADSLLNNVDNLLVAYTKKGREPSRANMNLQMSRILSDAVGGGVKQH